MKTQSPFSIGRKIKAVCRSAAKEGCLMERTASRFSQLEMWINFDSKVVSFREISGWFHRKYETQSEMLWKIELLVHDGYRFQ